MAYEKSLTDFNLKEEIYIDAPIFVYHHTNHPLHGTASTEFLVKIEKKEISAVTSSLTLDEVEFVLLKQRASEILKTENYFEIMRALRSDKNLMKRCYEIVKIFLEYVDLLMKFDSLRIAEVDYLTMKNAFFISKESGLLPRDGIHLAVMKMNHIQNIATADPDFDKVEEIRVWKP